MVFLQKTAYKHETSDSIPEIAPDLRAEQVYGGLQITRTHL